MGSQSDENTSNMESDSEETMSNNIEDDTSDDNQLSEYKVHVARRYSVLMRTFNEIFSIASHNEKAYRYVLGMAREVMSKVEELVSEEIQSDQIDGNQLPRNDASKVALEATSKKPIGIRKKDNAGIQALLKQTRN
ncbi:hypothetical protein FCM35_KLT06790 [Carex littledalei]|uniref:Uncharacterized protein n=1 Tax=Carex littledalei TaxID=544730 RepID=A0A833VLV7_9POAL|nr:hypothetical protein FCM35_KLT06790 [Carex littledalei]